MAAPRRSKNQRRPEPRRGDSELATQFFAGSYAEIVQSTFDAGDSYTSSDTAFVVGALTFVGRIEDAQLCFDSLRLRTETADPPTVAACHFFLGVAYARAGNFERAHWFLVSGARARTRSEPRSAAFALQGLACFRYFTGRFRAAARHAFRARRAAHVARFPYLQMLANDLRGHALAQLGQFRAGIGLLQQAKLSSEQLGFGMNAYAIECSIAIYLADSVAGSEVLPRVESLLGRRAHDSYSRRLLLTALARQLALRGRRTQALDALTQADENALALGTRRAKLGNVVTRLQVLRWSEGPAACAELLEKSADLVEQGDVALRAELVGFDAYVGKSLADEARRAQAIDALRVLARTAEHHRARAELQRLAATPLLERAFPEDELTPLLRAVNTQERSALPRLLSLGLLGPIPELLGLVPSRRIILLGNEHAVLLEDRGDLQIRSNPPRWFATLLHLLGTGPASKEAIVRALWGLRAYRPERHDSLIRTTIHRFRALVSPHGDWVALAPNGGYVCSVPILSFGADLESVELTELEVPLAEGEVPESPVTLTTRTTRQDPVTERVLALLQSGQRCSVRQVAQSLRISPSTALRALRGLVRGKLVTRSGYARATRYSAREAYDKAGGSS